MNVNWDNIYSKKNQMVAISEKQYEGIRLPEEWKKSISLDENTI